MSLKEDLIQARGLVEKSWCQGCYAKSASGYALTNGFDEGATCWCALGACEEVTGLPYGGQLKAILNRAANKLGHESAISLNDDAKSVGPVLEMFDLAIKNVEE